MKINNIQQPLQRLPFSKKTKEWRKSNLDYADKHSYYNNQEVRQSLKNKLINLNLYNGIVDVRDLTSIVNPFGIDASFVPDNIPHNPILVPKVDLLAGEEIKRRFDWSVVVVDPDSITKKEEDKKQFLLQKLTEFFQANYSDQELQQKMQELNKYMKYSYQDIREKMANQILKYYYQYEKMAEKFNKGFKDALIMAEEIYLVDIVFNEPRLTKLNPLKVQTVQAGNSDRIEDASMVIIEDYKSPNQIIDEYYDELKPEDIDYILDYTNGIRRGTYADDQNNHTLLRDAFERVDTYNTLFGLAEVSGNIFGSEYTDPSGNIRELKVRWKSLRKVKKIKYYDEYGETQYRFESEEYQPDKVMGEEASDFWVSEGWEGVKLGRDIYLKMKPLPIQYNKADQPGSGHLGVIGQVYNTNQGRAVSLIDRGKNLQYLYDAVFDRLNKAIATNYGKILELDLAKIPQNWEVEKWLHFAITNKIAVTDSFKEGNHGASTGKLAGSMNTVGGRSIDMETGSYIQQQIQLLEFIKNEIGEICGVSRQREGQISNRETVGGVERSVNQSSHVTEYWFALHESCKLRVLEAFLETAKYALKNNPKKIQYILDDQSIQLLEVDEGFPESDYGILVGDTTKAIEFEQAIKGYAQAFVQQGGTMSTVMDIYFASSLMDMRHKLENAEEEMHQRQSEQSQQQMQAQEKAHQESMQLEQQKLQLQEEKDRRDDETKRYIAELNHSAKTNEEIPKDNSTEDNSLELIKHATDTQFRAKDLELKKQSLDNDMKKHEDTVALKKAEQSIKRNKP